MPYAEENLQTLGLPLKKTTHSDEDMTRATLKETYAFIESDLKESLKSPRMDVDKDERWLVSQPAAKALMARFYLFTGDYEKAQKFADEALKSKNATLLDYNNLTTYTLDKGGFYNEETDESINDDMSGENSNALTYCETYNYAAYQFVNYQELYYPQFYTVTSTVNMLASQELVNLYDGETDLRYTNFYVKNGLIDYWVYGFNDKCIYHQFSSRNQWGQQMDVFVGASPTVAEMYLTKAEAMVRTGSWNEAMDIVNDLRKNRFSTSTNYSITANNQREALTQVLNERRRELPFVMRWYDIRRFAFNETPEDDIELRRIFYTIENGEVDFNTEKEYVLPVKSKRYAQPILTSEIQRSHGQIQQNQY